MSDTTSILDLPTDPVGGGNVANNITITAQEKQMPPQQAASGMSLDQTTINQIVNGLQQASLAGATTLPSRDIPLHTEQLTSDVQIQPNYIPQPLSKDYINEENDNINNYYNSEKNYNSLDSLYDELQVPLLLSVLYFLFQLPFFKKNLFKYLPFFCHSDGNYNLNGLIFTCALFGFIYYLLSKTVNKFSKF
jgi:hypothetical protein